MSPQCQAVLAYLKKHKSITRMEAYQIGICNLWARIGEIKVAYKIDGYMVKVRSRYGETHVKRYYLAGKKASG